MAMSYGPKFLHELRDGFHRDLSQANTNQTCAPSAELEPLDFVAPRYVQVDYGSPMSRWVILGGERIQYRRGTGETAWWLTTPSGKIAPTPSRIAAIHAELVALRDEGKAGLRVKSIGEVVSEACVESGATHFRWDEYCGTIRVWVSLTQERISGLTLRLRERVPAAFDIAVAYESAHTIDPRDFGAVADPDDLAGKSEAECDLIFTKRSEATAEQIRKTEEAIARAIMGPEKAYVDPRWKAPWRRRAPETQRRIDEAEREGWLDEWMETNRFEVGVTHRADVIFGEQLDNGGHATLAAWNQCARRAQVEMAECARGLMAFAQWVSGARTVRTFRDSVNGIDFAIAVPEGDPIPEGYE